MKGELLQIIHLKRSSFKKPYFEMSTYITAPAESDLGNISKDISTIMRNRKSVIWTGGKLEILFNAS